MVAPKIRYIALLRGINVGGHTVKMEYLRDLFHDAGFDTVRSYIQSGNIFFESTERNPQTLRKKIEKHLHASLGYDVPVCLRTIEEVEQILKHDPFVHVHGTPDTRLAITFLAEPASEDIPVPYSTPDGAYELIKMTPTELFVVWHLKNGRPGSSYGLMEKKLQAKGTTRFWHTSFKILAAAKQNPKE